MKFPTCSTQDGLTSAANTFGHVYIVEPSAQHTHTAILLHGRGSNGKEFAEELFDSTLPGQPTLAQKLPGWRLVFPSSKELWSSLFEEDLPAWFEAHSLTDTTVRQDLQMGGIRESVKYLTGILDEEIDRLRGDAVKVVLGGISQGGAIGMWTLLCSENPARRLGAFFGVSTWLPFSASIDEYLTKEAEERRSGQETSEAITFVKTMMAPLGPLLSHPYDFQELLSTPVFLGHGVDDATVDIDLGREARYTLARLGLNVEWKEYTGAELEGHWFKVPEEVDDITNFLMMATCGVVA